MPAGGLVPAGFGQYRRVAAVSAVRPAPVRPIEAVPTKGVAMTGSGKTVTFGRLRGWPGVRGLATVVALAVALVLIGPAPAQASWTLTDNLESASAPSTWVFSGVGAGGGGLEYNTTAHSGTNLAWLESFDESSWMSGGRSVHLGVAAGSCSASVFIRPLGRTRVNVEVIDPATWTYIALKSVTIGVSNGGYQPYQQIFVASWTVSKLDVFFRVSLLGSSGDWGWDANFDDLSIICNPGGRPL
jgi:hypothetical protein